MAKYKIVKLGRKNYLVFDWKDYATTASLGDTICFKELFKKIIDFPYIDNVIFKKSYRKILDIDSFKIFKEYVDVINNLPEEPDLCDDDFEKLMIFKYTAKEDGIGAIEHLKNSKFCKKDKEYFEILKNKLKKTKLWKLTEKYKKYPKNEMYHLIFKDRILPGFVTYITKKMDEKAKVLESYEMDGSEVTIYETPDRPNPVYYIKPKELNISSEKLKILNKAFQKLSKEEFDLKQSKTICKKVLNEVDETLKSKEKEELLKILQRYSFGYGVIEMFLKDENLQDVFIDSPGDKPIYVYHKDYEECETNIILSPEEIEKLSTRFRMISGRPFDESYPVLHAKIGELGIRIAGVTEPITFSGTGFAFRKHAVKPWTLQQFIKNKMITPEAAGLLSFLVHGQQSMLITGPRGSGKTSFLGALISEIPQKNRMIIIEDTPEIPVEDLRDSGFNIQHLKIKSTLQREAYEVTADEALRSALRLGESVLIIGEVRGEEAKSLFEAMRIGAAGNVVLGTIHGSSAYDVWDRIVNDLNVPSTSFKAANFIVSCAPIRKQEELKRNRRVVGITEVLKYWKEDPHAEKGFLNIFDYNRKRDKLILSEKELKKSIALKEIVKKRGMSMSQALKSIKTRAKIKEEIVKASKKNPDLLGLNFATKSMNKYYELTRLQNKKINYSKLLRDFKKWLKKQQKEFKD